jgi:hypothetical protein
MKLVDDLVPLLTLLTLVALVVLLLAVWLELRDLKRLLHSVLSSNRENARAVMAAVHEVAASLSRSLYSESPANRSKPKSRAGVD